MLLLAIACRSAPAPAEPEADVDLRSNPVRAGEARWSWPEPGDPKARVVVAGFRDDVLQGRPLTVRVDADTPASRVALMQEVTTLNHVQVSDGITREVAFLPTTDAPNDSPGCWLPILTLPGGELLVAGSGSPARHWQRAEHRRLKHESCTTTPGTAPALVRSLPSWCGTTAIAVDGTVSWGDLRPWLEALDEPALLVDRPEVLSNNAAAVHGDCEGAVEVGALEAP